jgi:dipeptidyl aminopeptidase/acylaminoacyl peptidase
MKIMVAIVSLLAVLGAGFAAQTLRTSSQNAVPGTTTETPAAPASEAVTPVTAVADVKPDKTVEPHPVSLEAFSRTPFDGRDLKIGPVLASNDAYVRHYVTYRSADLLISGIMNVPKGPGPFPLLVLNHGHIDTAIYTNGRGLKREQDYLARRGYVVLHTDYRNHAESDDDADADLRLRLGYAEDAVNAVLAVKAAGLPYVDAEHVGMLGHSMGGGVTLQTITAVPDLVDAAVLFAPVSADARDNFRRWTERRHETAERIRMAYGGPDENPEFWDGVSPIHRLDQIASAVMLHHGTADDSTPHEWSERLDAAMKEAGKSMTFHSYPDEPHEFIKAWPTVMARTAAFFDDHLKSPKDE